MDIDFDDIDVPSRKRYKFAPKKSKFKPDASAVVPKVEIDDSCSSVIKIDATDTEIDTDQVVREIDVFFTSTVDANSKLYVLQYPLRPCWRPYELEDTCQVARVRPETAEVEIEMSIIQAKSENVDDNQFAMRNHVLSTAWMPPVANGYAVGILIRNELHLNPVDAVVQLRPSMQHLKHHHDEEAIKNEKSINQVKKQGKLQGVVTEEQNTDIKEWIPLKYHGETSLLSHRYMENMVAPQDFQILFSMSQSDYIDSLCPVTSGVPTRSELLKLSLEERFKRHLLEGPLANRFNALKHIAPDASDEDIFKVLKEHARLIQGLWFAKNKLKCPTAEGRDLLLRDYAMLQFSKNPILHELQLPKQPTLSKHMKVILDEFAVKRDSFRDWKFKECPDESFIEKYPDIVKEQKEIWDDVEVRIMELLFSKNPKLDTVDRRLLASNNNTNVAPRTANVSHSERVTPDETRDVLPKALKKLFQAYKLCSMNQIRQGLRDMAVSENREAKGAADAPQEELERVLTEVAVNIHGSFVLRSSPDQPQYDELRNVVISLFLAEGPGGKLRKANIFAAAEVRLKREITSIEFQKVMSELCISQGARWVLRSGDI